MILVTGVAGFIGFHLALALLDRGEKVLGVDSLNEYYAPKLKEERLRILKTHRNADRFNFQVVDISENEVIQKIFSNNKIDIVVNLAAQAGVRYSLDNPQSYIDSNIQGFMNILEGCRRSQVRHLVYASSSSVYGMNTKQPFSTADRVDYPVSLYAATKKSNELMAHTYSHLFNIPTTGLRFFTVYGPYGRPDMAYYRFTESILNGRAIDVFNDGKMMRDFTYIDDIIEGVLGVVDRVPIPQERADTNSTAPYVIYNIGNNNPVSLEEFIGALEIACGREAKRRLLPMQPGDVPVTFADVDDLERDIGFKPLTPITSGLDKFVKWYKNYVNSVR